VTSDLVAKLALFKNVIPANMLDKLLGCH